MILHCIVDLAYKYLVLSLVYHKIFSKTEKVLVFILGGKISLYFFSFTPSHVLYNLLLIYELVIALTPANSSFLCYQKCRY